jgi:hypothetical protein
MEFTLSENVTDANEGLVDAIYLTPSDYLDSPYPVEVSFGLEGKLK